jgi:hypothetical protein
MLDQVLQGSRGPTPAVFKRAFGAKSGRNRPRGLVIGSPVGVDAIGFRICSRKTGFPSSGTLASFLSIHVTGSFDITLTPQSPVPAIEAAKLGRQTFDKTFHGYLSAHSLGEMLAAGTAVKGSAGYAAMERVTGTLQEKKGSFVLMHTGTMSRGASQLAIQVVPDSGTDALIGLTGTMDIQITDGKHFYTFDFVLP